MTDDETCLCIVVVTAAGEVVERHPDCPLHWEPFQASARLDGDGYWSVDLPDRPSPA